MDSGKLDATVVAPTRNRGALITETIQSLLRMRDARFEVLVVDQSTDTRTYSAVAAAAASDKRVQYWPTATIGSSAARNFGAILGAAEVVAYTDDDCVVTEGWLPALLASFEDPRVAAVYGRLLPYGAGQRTGTEVGLKDCATPEIFDGKEPPWHIGHGGNMAFRRETLLKCGGFDPLLGAGCPLRSGEDGDIAYRLLSRGYRIAYAPAALSYHKHWKSWPEQKRMERAYGIGIGAQVGKHWRCGDAYAARLLAVWLYELGLRRVGSGLLKWRSRRVMYLGYCQLVYPWLGLWRGRRYAVDCAAQRYRAPAGQAQYEALKVSAMPALDVPRR